LLHRYGAKARLITVVFVALQLAGCSSAEERAQRYYESGMKLLAAHEDQKAAVEFRNAVKLKQDFLPAWRGLAQTQEDIHNWPGLSQVLQTILDLDPKDQATRIKLARLLLAGGAFDRSLKLINESSEPDSNNASILALKAVIFYKLKDVDTAVRDAKEALKIEPGNADASVVLAADRLANNDPNAALQILSTAKQNEDRDVGVDLFKLKIYAQLKDYASVESILKKLVERYPQAIDFRKNLVNLYIAQHRPEDAEKELRAIAAADPKNQQYTLELIRFLYTVKGPAAAHDELIARINAGGEIFPYQLALAELEFDQGQIDDSFKALESLINSTSLTQAQIATAKVMLAEFNLRRKDTDAAEKIVNDVLAIDQRNDDALKLRASIRLGRNQVDGAISDLRQALNDQPRSTDFMLMLATAYELKGSIDLADKQLADALKVSNFNVNVGLDYVGFLRRRGGNDRAYEVLTELANRWPNNMQVLTALADARLARQDWTGAQQVADAIKHLGANSNVVADQISGAALAGEQKYDASIAALQSAVTAAPSAVQPLAALVSTMVRAKQTDRAIAFLQTVLKENSNNAEAYVLLGNIQVAKNALDQAEDNFKKAISSEPKNEIGYQALSKLYLQENKIDAAQDIIRTALKTQPDNANLHMSLAGILELKGDYEAAISEYDSLLKQQPGSLIITNNLASLLTDHRTDKASLDRAQSLAASLRQSQVPQFKDTLGWVEYRQGNFKSAVPLLQEAVAAIPGSPLVHYHLGMSYLGIGDGMKASDEFTKALTLGPDSELQAKIRDELKNITAR
jgi:cellulose synthase operon protein C